MRTPYGADCKFYYADFNRGRHTEECRLPRRDSEKWTPELCRTCPVPRILLANSCQHMQLQGKLEAGILGFGRKMTVTASCPKFAGPVAEPAIGCPHCHDDLPPLKFTLPE
jgi:hypothetical protein